ncbi:MAG TPA: TIGR01777 family oxidoreductase [Kiloniellales bacterium]|nr:TIGR01777 family oxidoreductase [Kiloniellales bacterium]
MTALQMLVAVQMALGLFDILYHHELTERLCWRPTAARELGLHAARNALYALTFLTLAWVEWQGPLAWGFALLLVAETILTLADFLEEDRSRLLPPSERVTHALLALNFGAIVALLAPELLRWSAAPLGVALVDRGLWSWALTAATVGIALWSLRERRRRTWCLGRHASARGLSQPFLAEPRRLLVTGGTGFIGRRLVEALVAGGHQVTVLTRDPRKAAALARPVEFVATMAELPRHRHFDGVVHLAGEPVAQPWGRLARRRMVESRVELLRQVAEWCAAAASRPAVLVTASAIGVYGDGGETALTERSPAGAGFAAELCQVAEQAAATAADRLGSRLVILRFGLVLAADGGFLGRLLLPFELGLRLRFGSGRQWLSWLHRDDAVRLICWALGRLEASGVYNAVAPMPVMQAAFAKSLSAALVRLALPVAVPARLIRLGFGQMGRELFLASQKVLPQRAAEQGFRFRFPFLEAALAEIVGGRVRGRARLLNEGLVLRDRRQKRPG